MYKIQISMNSDSDCSLNTSIGVLSYHETLYKSCQQDDLQMWASDTIIIFIIFWLNEFAIKNTLFYSTIYVL